MELGSLVDLIFQDLIFVLSDIIEYHCLFYILVYEAYHLREH